MTAEQAFAILKADAWVLTRDQSHAMAHAVESALTAERERAEKIRGRLTAMVHILKQNEQMHHQEESWPEWQQRIEETEK